MRRLSGKVISDRVRCFTTLLPLLATIYLGISQSQLFGAGGGLLTPLISLHLLRNHVSTLAYIFIQYMSQYLESHSHDYLHHRRFCNTLPCLQFWTTHYLVRFEMEWASFIQAVIKYKRLIQIMNCYAVNCSEVAPHHSCSLEEFINSVKKTNICIKGILQTPTGGGGKSELQSTNMVIRLVIELNL